MKKGEWTFVTNHGLLLAYMAKHPDATTQKMAFDAGLSIRAVCKAIIDLKAAGYVTWEKVGRRNHYTVYSNKPMRHSLERDYQVRGLLGALGCNGHQEIPSQSQIYQTAKVKAILN